MYSKLVESVVEQVLFFCPGIWRHNRYSEIDTVLNKARRMYLDVSKLSQIPHVDGVGVGFHAKFKHKLGVVRLCFCLRNMSDNRLVKQMHNYSFNMGKSFGKLGLKRVLRVSE